MALSRKKATTIALDPEDDRLLSVAAQERGVSRSEFIRRHLALVLEQYRRHPKPRSAGIVKSLTDRGDERELSVPAGSAAALICDTGAYVRSPQHGDVRLTRELGVTDVSAGHTSDFGYGLGERPQGEARSARRLAPDAARP